MYIALFLSALLFFFLQLHYTTASTSDGFEVQFGYSGEKGPNTNAWSPLCHNGDRQSPIDIHLASAVSSDLAPINFHNYDYRGPVVITNNGHSVTASGFEKWGARDSKQPFITGGGLDGKYFLVGFHFHWGTHDKRGSEHTVNGQHFPLEIHFVHQKANLTAVESKSKSDGLAVVAVWFYIDNNNDKPLAQLETAYLNTEFYEQTFNINDVLLDDMIPSNRAAYFRYNGSLTTPSCEESVIWTIFQEPLTVVDRQVKCLAKFETTKRTI
uniref:Carbonic anhydrase n=1 Tax=Plectus sambesii TaxID=2011161 RepID=A0A914XFT3_9BILA